MTGTKDENYSVRGGHLHLFRAFRKSRLTPFVCQWHAFQRERAFQITRLDRLSHQFSEIMAAPFRRSEQGDQAESPFQEILSSVAS